MAMMPGLPSSGSEGDADSHHETLMPPIPSIKKLYITHNRDAEDVIEHITNEEGYLKVTKVKPIHMAVEDVDFRKLKLCELIGHGTDGWVFRAEYSTESHFDGPDEFAVKIFASTNDCLDGPNAAMISQHELMIARNLRLDDMPDDVGIVRILAEATLDTGPLPFSLGGVKFGKAIIMEYCTLGEAFYLMKNLGDEDMFYPEDLLWSALWDLTTACSRLTDPMQRVDGTFVPILLNFDIRPENVFITETKDSRLTFKMGDYGRFCVHPYGAEECPKTTMNTIPPFNNPQHPNHSPKTDLYSCVLVVYMVATRGIPPRALYGGECTPSVYKSYMPPGGIVVNRIPQCYSIDLQEFFVAALNEDEDNRLSPSEAVTWLKQRGPGGRLLGGFKLPREVFGRRTKSSPVPQPQRVETETPSEAPLLVADNSTQTYKIGRVASLRRSIHDRLRGMRDPRARKE